MKHEFAKRKHKPIGLKPGDWESYCVQAGILNSEGDTSARQSAHARSVRIGNFLSRFVDREVPVAVKGRTGKATLRVHKGRARAKLYYFEVRWDAGQKQLDLAPKTPLKKKRRKQRQSGETG